MTGTDFGSKVNFKYLQSEYLACKANAPRHVSNNLAF